VPLQTVCVQAPPLCCRSEVPPTAMTLAAAAGNSTR